MADIEFGRDPARARRSQRPVSGSHLPALVWHLCSGGNARRHLQKINDGINKALQNPKVERQLSVANNPGKSMPLTELAALMKADTRG
jgi:hypothetical protein